MTLINQKYNHTLQNIKRNGLELIDIHAYEYDNESKAYQLRYSLLICKAKNVFYYEKIEKNTWYVENIHNLVNINEICIIEKEIKDYKKVGRIISIYL
jgi:hypothetical protein